MAALRMGGREWALLIILSVLWGASFFFAAVAVKQIEPFTLAFLRTGLAALALAAIGALLGHRLPRDPALWLGFLFLGSIGTAAPFSLIYWGQTEISGSLTSIINAATPFWTLLVAHFLTRDERFTLRRGIGVLTGFSGVAIIMAPSAFAAGAGGHLLAEAAVLAAALCYAVSSVFAKRFRGIAPIVLACGQLTTGAVIMLPVMLIFDSPFSRPLPDANAIAATLAIALLSTALAYILYFQILRAAGANNVVLVTLLVPVSAIFLGALILGEELAPRHFAGLALIAAGLTIIDGRVLGFLRTRQRGKGGRDASGMARRPMLKDAPNP